ncbi:MAG: SIR2 family protein, partial [Planctomycetota bacterium]
MSADDKNKDLLQRAREVLAGEYRSAGAFNESFDADEPIRVPSPTADVGEYTFSRSEALFWLDPVAYADERAAWNNKTIQDRHGDALKLLKGSGLSTEFAHLVEAVQRNRIVPFVGAGMSRPMDFPLWIEALQSISGRLPDFQIGAFNAALGANDYLTAAQCLLDHDAAIVANYIRTTFGRCAPRGPVTRLPGFSRGCIVTTNFDPVIEQVFKDANRQLDAYMHGTQEHNFFARLARGERCILKLHGDAESQPTHVFTKAQYEASYGATTDFSKPLPKALRQVFIGHSLLFLGCSLEADRTLSLFAEVKS